MERIIYVGELDRTPHAPDHMGIRQGLQSLKEEGEIEDYLIVDPILNKKEDIIEKCNSFHPTVVIHGNTDSLNLGIAPYLLGYQIIFMGDCMIKGNYPWQNWKTQGFSLVAISNEDQIEDWSKRFNCPAVFWPHGSYVPDNLVYDEKEEYDVLFIGSMINDGDLGERTKLIKEIGKEVNITHITADDVDGRNEIWKRMPALYHSSKVVLDISHFWTLKGYASGRYWYTGGLGACAVTKRFPRCEEFYPQGTKWYFDTADEAVKLIKELLEDKDRREKTKLLAYERNRVYHNYNTKFKELLCMKN